MEKHESLEDENSFVKRITSDNDPQPLEEGDEIEIVFHPSEKLPSDIPTSFIVGNDPEHPNLDVLSETTPGFEGEQDIFHTKKKLVSPSNLFEVEGLRGKRTRQIAAAAAIIAAAGGATWLIIKKRKQ